MVLMHVGLNACIIGVVDLFVDLLVSFFDLVDLVCLPFRLEQFPDDFDLEYRSSPSQMVEALKASVLR